MAEPGIDRGHTSLRQLKDVYAKLELSNANEAETRAKVIEALLKGVLYWLEEDIEREERAIDDGKTKFVDYVLRTASTAIVIEAKRAGGAFVLPNNRQSGKLGGWLSKGEIGNAIRQTRDYCIRKSIPFGVVTNGAAWIVFPAVRTDGVPFADSQARVFRSIDDIDERFVEFWELLSRQRVTEGNLESEMVGPPDERFSRRALTVLKEPGFRLGRNALFDHIESAVHSSFSDEALLTNREALRLCYVKTSDRTKFDNRIKMYLSDVRPPLERPSIRVGSRKNRKQAEKAIVDPPSSAQRFILVLGPVGAGKSTFISYTREVSARDQIDKKLLWLYIDFKKATVSDAPREFIYGELLRLIEDDKTFGMGEWEHTIRPAYRKQVDALSRGALQPIKRNDPVEFERRVSDMIAKEREAVRPYVEKILQRVLERTPGYLIIDNVDQLPTDQAQSNTFMEAQAIARRIGINVIMSLRDATYLRHRTSPAFDAFQVETLFVEPPSVLPVLSRRCAYAKTILAGKSARIKTEQGFTVDVDDLSVFFDIVSHSLFSGSSGYMFEVLAAGDIRRGIQLAREFLASGHTSADKALQCYLSGEDYSFPPHEVFKGTVLGQRKFYREEESLLPNLFDSKLKQRTLGLLRLTIVGSLVEAAAVDSFEGIALREMVDQFYKIGVSAQDVKTCVVDLVNTRILKTANALDVADDSALLPTRLAGYLLTAAGSSFSYLEMCALDAWILDEHHFESLRDLTTRIESRGDFLEKIEMRLKRVETFLDYLAGVEESWVVESRRKNVTEKFSRPYLKERILPVFEKDEKSRVLQSARKTRGRANEKAGTA